MAARIYVIPVSHPAAAGVAMLRHKRIPHRVVRLMPGLQPLLVRFAGFERHTVPGARPRGVEGAGQSRDRALPGGAGARSAAVPGRRRRPRRGGGGGGWGEREPARLWMEREVMRVPASPALQFAFLPIARRLAKLSHSDEETVRDSLARLPEPLDQVDALIGSGTISGARPNAADFQILAGVRVLLEFEDLVGLFEGRPCEPAARRLFPD
jgi:hypothetical protein